ncbi:MAG: DUF2490 domain-containing protein [Pseudomonadales bacterium]
MPGKCHRRLTLFLLMAILTSQQAAAAVQESQTGLWSMLFFTRGFHDSAWGLQGDVQLRQWDVGTDLEQLLLRGGVTYRPHRFDGVLLTLGYADISSGEFGPSDATNGESRIYQEALLSRRVGDRLQLRHRFRLEQRWVAGQDFRTRFRYALFADLPLNGRLSGPGALYLAFYNELFLNGERRIGDGRRVRWFDRNRTYLALGFGLSDKLRAQAGFMHQESDQLGKGQWQLSVHASL